MAIKWKTSLSPNEQFYASPLVYCGVVLVAGMQNNVYVLDAKTGAIVAKTSLGTPYNIARDMPKCADVTPTVGILSTPVIDNTTNTVYLVSSTYVNSTAVGLRNNM